MTTTISESNRSQLAWKMSAVVLAVVVAILGLAVGLESYYLYREHRPEGALVQQHVSGQTRAANRSSDPALVGLDDGSAVFGPTVNGSPWDQLNTLQQRMDQMFDDTLHQIPADDSALASALSRPNLDVREEKDHYTVRADMPGADKSSLKVNVEGRLLTISGERTSANETKDNDKVIQSERSMAQFVRSIELPGPVKAETVDAKYDNGVLTLTLPKADQSASSSQVTVH